MVLSFGENATTQDCANFIYHSVFFDYNKFVIHILGGSYDTVKRNLIQTLPSHFERSENEIYAYWLREKLHHHTTPYPFSYSKLSESQEKKYHYIPMPPPNITGQLHLGHALFLTIQDCLMRYWRAKGEECLWLPGLDHAGLATHEKIISHQLIHGTIYEESAEYISKTHKKIILEQIQKMGALPNWERLTYTMDNDYQGFCIKALKLLWEDGRITFKEGQFYLDISDLAQELLLDIESNQITIAPEKEIGKLTNFLRHIEPWCISRQMPWGIKIPLNEELLWNEALLNENCIGSQGGLHTLDTWFNSSLWPLATLHTNPEDIQKFYPASLIETGADILFFWCARMLMMGNYLFKNQKRLGLNIKTKYPFYDIYLHGLIRDKHNRKFSKSLGNGIDPLELIEKFGSDTLRLFLLTRTGPGEDMKFNPADLAGMQKFTNKIWNSARFFSLYADKHGIEKYLPQEMPIHEKLQQLRIQYDEHFESLRFLEASRELIHIFKHWFCDEWIEGNKEQIQNGNIDKIREGLGIFWELLRMLNPMCPFITDELRRLLFECEEST